MTDAGNRAQLPLQQGHVGRVDHSEEGGTARVLQGQHHIALQGGTVRLELTLRCGDRDSPASAPVDAQGQTLKQLSVGRVVAQTHGGDSEMNHLMEQHSLELLFVLLIVVAHPDGKVIVLRLQHSAAAFAAHGA